MIFGFGLLGTIVISIIANISLTVAKVAKIAYRSLLRKCDRRVRKHNTLDDIYGLDEKVRKPTKHPWQLRSLSQIPLREGQVETAVNINAY
jgi:hypothetical protein